MENKIVAYCVKCRGKREMLNVIFSKTSRGTSMAKGKCPDCGTNMCRIGVAE